jgi:hypothetical protein
LSISAISVLSLARTSVSDNYFTATPLSVHLNVQEQSLSVNRLCLNEGDLMLPSDGIQDSGLRQGSRTIGPGEGRRGLELSA